MGYKIDNEKNSFFGKLTKATENNNIRRGEKAEKSWIKKCRLFSVFQIAIK